MLCAVDTEALLFRCKLALCCVVAYVLTVTGFQPRLRHVMICAFCCDGVIIEPVEKKVLVR